MEYGDYKKHSAGARNVRARAKLALLLPSFNILTAGNVLKCLFGKSKGLKSKIDPGWVKNVIVEFVNSLAIMLCSFQYQFLDILCRLHCKY